MGTQHIYINIKKKSFVLGHVGSACVNKTVPKLFYVKNIPASPAQCSRDGAQKLCELLPALLWEKERNNQKC
jgi:hypothetical protein